eukprot:gb/GECG01004915.1/.p1 GENE.gb/GECG01004915.1/~~gb/GECG01004915.1/.p1  ORF type:complete len:292 (+),score=32.73 gb/GECG01004915.1/:1-876(+)
MSVPSTFSAGHTRLVRTLYKQLMRQARAFDECLKQKQMSIYPELAKMTVPNTSIYFERSNSGSPTSYTTAEQVVRTQFRSFQHFTDAEDVNELLAMSFRALRQMQHRQKSLVENDFSRRPANLQYHVGQVAVHRLHGYKCVIYGWDEWCNQSEEWILQMGIDRLKKGRNQPFYHCLADLRDRAEPALTYVAQDNIVPVAPDSPVYHPMAEKFFSQFINSVGYVPQEFVHYEYPEDSCLAFSVEELQHNEEGMEDAPLWSTEESPLPGISHKEGEAGEDEESISSMNKRNER